MYRFLVVFVVILMTCNLDIQAQKIKGQVLDAKTDEPIGNVNISVVGETSGGSTNADGHFEFSVYTLPALLYFSHLNYAIANVSVSQKNRKSLVIYLAKESVELDEVQISAEKIQKIPLGDTLNVIDYVFAKNDRILLVASPFRKQADQRLYLTDLNGRQLSSMRVSGLGKEIKVPEHMTPEFMYFFEDYLGAIQLLTKKEVQQIDIQADTLLSRYSTSYPKFLRYIFPVKAMLGGSIFQQRSDQNYNRTLRTGPDAYRPQEVKKVYDPLGKPGKNRPCRYQYFPGQPSYIKKFVSAPVVKREHDIMIFDFFDNHISIIDSIGQELEQLPLSFHLIDKREGLIFTVNELNQEAYNQKIIEDKVTGKLYVLFQRFGRKPELKELDPMLGKTIQTFDFPDYPHIDKVKVHNSMVYFTYHVNTYPFYTSLYKMRL